MRAPAVSVVLPSYNRAHTLDRAIRSVLDQTFQDFELLIIDDRSTDDTAAVLDGYVGQDKVAVISQLRPSCARARNIGVSAARGRYVAFQDSDDEWDRTMLERAVTSLDGSGTDVGVFYTDMLRIEEDGRQWHWGAPDVRLGVLINEETLDYQVSGIGIQAAVIKRECFDRVGLFDTSLPRLIDLELFIRLSQHYVFVHCNEPLVKYYACEGISTNLSAEVIARRYLLMKYGHRLERHTAHLLEQRARLAAASRQDEVAALTARLLAKEAELARITNSTAWRVMNWYGRRIKQPLLLPIYRAFGLHNRG